MSILELKEIASFASGGTPKRSVPEYFNGDIAWITGADIGERNAITPRSFITAEAVTASAVGVVPKGTLLLVTRTSVGKVAVADRSLGFSQDITAVHPDLARVDPQYLARCLAAYAPQLSSQARGATIQGVTRAEVGAIPIPLPHLPEQRRIAAILDQADDLRAKRRRALELLDEWERAVFEEMFGDPALNPRSWPSAPLGDLAIKYSDGPFGSNLKSSHYASKGVRVIRLQNIGVGKFVDRDKAYISEAHFLRLAKHECLPGDVLIGTLGEPNLRACVQPEAIELAINKADCVQFRANLEKVGAAYIVGLLNHPAVAVMAQHLVLGQTRARISMGRLRGLHVPVPPIQLQLEYGRAMDGVARARDLHRAHFEQIDELFASLQQRAFSGHL
jgi:type I restriction enzyme S subunit